MMTRSNGNTRQRLWDLVRKERTALLVTVHEDGSLDARPMGCLQHRFDGTLWFLTFRHSDKLREIGHDRHVLVSYSRPSRYHYVAVTGRARLIDDKAKLEELWTESLRTWFPEGVHDPELALLAVTVERARYWTRPASLLTYGWANVRARLTGRAAGMQEIAEVQTLELGG